LRLLPPGADWMDEGQWAAYRAALADEDEPDDPDLYLYEDPDSAPPPGLDDAQLAELIAGDAAGDDDRYAGASDDELVGAICAWDRAEAHMAARKHAAVAELIRRRPKPGCALEGAALMPAAEEGRPGRQHGRAAGTRLLGHLARHRLPAREAGLGGGDRTDGEPGSGEYRDGELDGGEDGDGGEPGDAGPGGGLDGPGGAGPGPTGPDGSRTPGPGGPGTGAIPPGFAGRVTLTIPVATLLDLAERPGEIPGIGPIDPALARDLASAAVRNPRTTWCVTVTDAQGHAIGHGCARPEPSGRGTGSAKQQKQGPPGGHNPPSEPRFRLKQQPGWTVDQLPDGTFRWTTPSGRSYDTEPTCYPI
jgi:hypothetical protein